jgi:nucleoside-diphosphate-sugar epimerase
VHCAAKVGDWGPVEDYRAVNVRGLENLLSAVESESSFKKFVQISSLGVYEARDHYGTDEAEPLNSAGIDGYTLTKIEAEQLLDVWLQERSFPAVVLRPGFIYGPRDRTVLPRIYQRLKVKGVKYLGSGQQLMNNTYVGNLVDAVFLALENDHSVGEKYNITDGRLVSKREFMTTIAEGAGYEIPQGAVALPVARVLAKLMEASWKLLGKKEAPLLSNARIKFMGLNLDFSIEKAKHRLGYQPAVDFTQGMQNTVEWFRKQELLP